MNKQMQEILDKYAELKPVPIESASPAMARQLPELRDAVLGVLNDHVSKRLVQGVIEPITSVEHLLIPGPGGEMLLRIYRPNAETRLPVLLYFHGGGFVIGTLNSYDSSCRSLANGSGCLVVSLAYRQAPEHPYPAAHEDAFAAYRWLVSNANTLGGNGERVAVAGESAGGNLAISVCLKAREKGLQAPLHQLLVYPLVDNDMGRTSYLEHENAHPLNRRMMKWFFSHVAPSLSPTDEDTTLLPIHADLRGLPSATIILAEIDPLYSEGEAFAAKLREAGVHVSLRAFKGVGHEFFGMGALVKEARDAVRFASENLAARLFLGDDSAAPGWRPPFDDQELRLGYPA